VDRMLVNCRLRIRKLRDKIRHMQEKLRDEESVLETLEKRSVSGEVE